MYYVTQALGVPYREYFLTYMQTCLHWGTHAPGISNGGTHVLPPFALIRDFGKHNTRGNVSKISVNLTCYRHVGSKSTNQSPLAWRRESQRVTLVAVIGGFRSDMSITHKIDGNFGNVSASVLFFQSRVSTKTVVRCITHALEYTCTQDMHYLSFSYMHMLDLFSWTAHLKHRSWVIVLPILEQP